MLDCPENKRVMRADGQFDEFLRNIEPMTPLEQREMLLRYFTVLIGAMDFDSVVALRTRLLNRFPPSQEQDTIIEVIDGHIALRQISANETV